MTKLQSLQTSSQESRQESIKKKLNQAIQLHQAGDLVKAAKLYRTIIHLDPTCPDALHLLGAIAAQNGDHESAADLIQKAIVSNPSIPAYHYNLGLTYRALGRFADAITHYQATLQLNPKHRDAQIMLGNVYQEQGLYETAVKHYKNVLERKPDHIEVLNDYGNALSQLGKFYEAIQCYVKALEYKPDFVDALNNLGNALHQQGRHGDAIVYLEEALRLNPEHVVANNNLGNVLHKLGHLDQAIIHYKNALGFDSDYAPAQINLGNLFQQQGNYEEAIKHFYKALRINPNDKETLNNIGNALQQIGRLEESEDCLERVLQIDSHHAAACNNLGNVLRKQAKLNAAIEYFYKAVHCDPLFAEAHNNLANALKASGDNISAVDHYRQALCLKPDYAVAHANLGNTFRDQGNYKAALEQYQQALLIDPTLAEAHLNKGLVLLTLGQFPIGWQEYAWRTHMLSKLDTRRFTQASWDGSALTGQRLLVHAEQGLGDTFHFIRYLPMLKQRSAYVIFECQQTLLTLLRGFPGIDELVPRDGDKIPDVEFDVHVSLLDLPGLFGTTLQTIPAAVPYINSDLEGSKAWELRLGSDSLKVGLVWAGNPEHANDHNRSSTLNAFSPLTEIPNVTFYSLQKGAGEEQLLNSPAGMPVVNLAQDLNSFTDTAAVVANLDLLITVDTSVAHLAGAMGKPVWTLLPYIPEWRWLLGREDTPWYPTMRLFRQAKPKDWNSVMERVASSLSELVHGESIGKEVKVTVTGATAIAASESPPLPKFARTTVLFSTTRMWNAGDDFILFGAQNLLKPMLGSFNSVVYNRNPDLHNLRVNFDQVVSFQAGESHFETNLYQLLKPYVTHRDNSWHESFNTDTIDLAVFAGTPEWMGVMVSPLVDSLVRTKVPTLYLGIGAFEGTSQLNFDQLPVKDQLLLIKAHLISVRDKTCSNALLGPLNVNHLPCPAIFASDICKSRRHIQRIALSTQGISARNGQKIHPAILHYSVRLFRALAEQYDCALICHYIDELTELRPLLGDAMEFVYSYDARDYLEIYDEFDLTVTTRVHGAGICASLGIPAFVISHSTRSSTAEGFLANMVDPQNESVNAVIGRIAQFDIAAASVALIKHKEASRARYEELLTPVLEATGLLHGQPTFQNKNSL